MKKRIILAMGGVTVSLAALAFVVLNNQKDAKEEELPVSENLFVESTFSNEQTFGKNYGEVELNSSEAKLCSKDESLELVSPKIGYQTALSSDGTKISIRYAALISSLDVEATWTRALYDSNGDSLEKLPKGEVSVSHAYEGITNNGEVTFANTIKDENGNTPYNYFVVYTLLDVPLELYGTDYLDAYLTISNDKTSKTTKVGALEINQNDFFTYELAPSYLSFDEDLINKEFIISDCSDEYISKVEIPTYYSNDNHRYKVTTLGDNSFNDCNVENLVLPTNITKISSDVFNINSKVEHICYMGNKEELSELNENNAFDSFDLYYYDSNLSKCNNFSFDSDLNVVLSNVSHQVLEKEESITATCTKDGLCDLVSYCSVCDKELSRTTKEKKALGHLYSTKVEENSLGHSYTKHECELCDDIYCTNLSVDYKKTYEYETLTTNALYSDYCSDIESMYKTLYDGCMNVLNSKEDFTLNWNGNTEHLIASAAVSKMNLQMGWVIANNFTDVFPEFYFVSNSVYYGGTSIYLVLNHDYLTYASRKNINDGILSVEEEFTKEFYSANLSDDVAKARFVHDYIANNLFYQNDETGKPSSAAFAHSIVGFMDQNPETGGVCECYAKVYLYLTRLIGINSILVVGLGGGGGHAWNYTEIDGKWYGVDVTWDDQGENIYTDFFLASKDFMEDAGYRWGNAPHTPGESDLTNANNSSYFTVLPPELASSYAY